MILEAIRFNADGLEILDQLQLPHTTAYETIRSSQDAWHAIKAMRVRGAPAIAIVAALSLSGELDHLCRDGKLSSNAEEVAVFIKEKLQYLITSRPTAVNLADAAGKLSREVDRIVIRGDSTGEKVKAAYCAAAEKMLLDDRSSNKALGRFGANWILKNTTAGKQAVKDHEAGSGLGKVSVVTHCNTGSLATAGYGTALGIVRSLNELAFLHHAYCTETRPYNQGSRLTAFELVHDQIPSTLITDSMAAALLQLKGHSDNIAAIVVGADRVAANGDTANKIGTYSLAVLARHHGAKFIVAAPWTTIDSKTASGKDIVIEERPADEVTQVSGPICQGQSIDVHHVERVNIAATGINVWNPAFDVTPFDLIDAIITDRGALQKKSDGSFDTLPIMDETSGRVSNSLQP